MRKHFFALLLTQALALSGIAAAEEQGWFLEQPSPTTFGSSADLLVSHVRVSDVHVPALNAGYRFNEAFTILALFREVIMDPARVLRCEEGDFACAAVNPPALDDATGYSLSLMPALMLHDDLAVYGHLGIQGWNVEANGNPDLRRRELLFGIGVGYDISNPLRLQLEYRSLDLDIKLTSVGFSWRF